jgi:hypothetical protein
VTFCGRCGHELPTPDGRFCGRCGHEAVRGNARYPLYADGSAAVTRRRPRVVADAERTVVRAAVEQTAVRADPSVTRPRLPIALVDTGAGLDGVLPASRWSTAMVTTLAVMLVVAVLGAWLMLH